jgi:hypothetical protein
MQSQIGVVYSSFSDVILLSAICQKASRGSVNLSTESKSTLSLSFFVSYTIANSYRLVKKNVCLGFLSENRDFHSFGGQLKDFFLGLLVICAAEASAEASDK